MHTYLGRYRLGDVVSIPLTAVGADGTAVLPSSPPRARIVSLGPGAPGYYVEVSLVALESPDVLVAQLPLLSSTPPYTALEPGRFTARIAWVSGGIARVHTATFDLTSVGDAGGGVISLHEVRRAPRRSAVAQLQSGVLVVGSNPKVVS